MFRLMYPVNTLFAEHYFAEHYFAEPLVHTSGKMTVLVKNQRKNINFEKHVDFLWSFLVVFWLAFSGQFLPADFLLLFYGKQQPSQEKFRGVYLQGRLCRQEDFFLQSHNLLLSQNERNFYKYLLAEGCYLKEIPGTVGDHWHGHI